MPCGGGGQVVSSVFAFCSDRSWGQWFGARVSVDAHVYIRVCAPRASYTATSWRRRGTINIVATASQHHACKRSVSVATTRQRHGKDVATTRRRLGNGVATSSSVVAGSHWRSCTFFGACLGICAAGLGLVGSYRTA